MKAWKSILVASAIAGATNVLLPVQGMPADLMADWTGSALPPPPELKAVNLDGKTTALLILDVMKQNCGVRPRCPATVPKIKALMDRARAAGALIAYTLPGNGEIMDPGIAPRDGELVKQEQGGPDKFLGTDLEQRLKARGIKTVIITGTSAQGIGIGTGSAAAQRGYNVIYPIDGVASESAFQEVYAAYHMAGGGPPVTTKWVTVTRSDMITFKPN